MRVARLFFAFILVYPPGWGECRLIRTSLRPPVDAYILPSPSIFGRGSYLPTTKNRFGCRGDRLFPPACQRFIPTPLLRHGVGRVVCTYTHKLSLTATLHSAVNPSSALPLCSAKTPPLAIPTRKHRHLHYVIHSARAAIRHHPPTHSGLMNARIFACGTRFSFIARGRYADGSIFNPTRHNVAQWLFTAHSILRSASPVIAKSEHR